MMELREISGVEGENLRNRPFEAKESAMQLTLNSRFSQIHEARIVTSMRQVQSD
jgi:hypothetical protein